MHLSPTSKLGYLSFKMVKDSPVLKPSVNSKFYKMYSLDDTKDTKIFFLNIWHAIKN